MLCDANGVPLRFLLSGGQTSDIAYAQPLLDEAYIPSLRGRPKYRQRNIIERMIGWLKENRRIVTRFDKLPKCFAAMVSLACAMRCLRHYFSYRA